MVSSSASAQRYNHYLGLEYDKALCRTLTLSSAEWCVLSSIDGTTHLGGASALQLEPLSPYAYTDFGQHVHLARPHWKHGPANWTSDAQMKRVNGVFRWRADRDLDNV